MRGLLLCGWLLVPAIALAYHYGPGQQQLRIDDAGSHLRAASKHVAAKRWPKAVAEFTTAIELLPATEVRAIRAARLERAKAQMQASQLPEAYDDLTLMMEELEADKTAPVDSVRDTREALAGAQYYLTWLMRLEGQPREEWEPQIEAARQNYALLVAQADDEADAKRARKHEEDLEASIRLAQLDLSELQALPLPSQCNCCKSGACKCKGKGKTPKPKTGENDARGASSGPPPDEQGS
jgi:hypothetical protein